MPTQLNQEAQQLLAVGQSASDPSISLNLRSKLNVLNYLRIADEISEQMQAVKSPRLLDWGSGHGQMSYLLARRGFEVISYQYIESSDEPAVKEVDYSFGELSLPITLYSDPVKIPFPDGHFDAVLSCGVLEHVDNEEASLDEIWRVLKPGGFFFVYQLPQEGSWLEFFIRKFKLGYYHEHRYTVGGVRRLLSSHRFSIQNIRRANMLPKSFTGLPTRLRTIWEKYPFFVLKADRTLAKIPLLNQLGGILELTARKS